jgi:DNA-binding XRE family transcriptional regulator
VKKAQRSAAKASPAAKPESSEAPEAPKARGGRQAQFDAEKLSSYRAQLGITRVQMAQLIGASALSVYKWESGKVQPRAAQTAQILAVLKLGKRAALAKLAEGAAG